MGKILAVIGAWLSNNIIQKALTGAGLGLVSYFGILTAVRVSFNSMINSVNSLPSEMLSLLGLFGIDHVLSTFVSVAIFLMTLNSGKIALRKK